MIIAQRGPGRTPSPTSMLRGACPSTNVEVGGRGELCARRLWDVHQPAACSRECVFCTCTHFAHGMPCRKGCSHCASNEGYMIGINDQRSTFLITVGLWKIKSLTVIRNVDRWSLVLSFFRGCINSADTGSNSKMHNSCGHNHYGQ